MTFVEEIYMLDGKKILLRSARADESQMLILMNIINQKIGIAFLKREYFFYVIKTPFHGICL